MRFTYDYHKRQSENNAWLLKHIEVLLGEAKTHSNTSFIMYAALEARNILEKTEFDIMRASTDKSEWPKIADMAKGRNGITKTNKEYKGLKYRYQTFSEAFVRVITDLNLKVYNYKQSEYMQDQVSEYLHVYTKTEEEMHFDSAFIQEGVLLIQSVVEFIKNYYVLHDGTYVFGLLNFSTLNGGIKEEFEKWKSGVDEDAEALYLRLKAINDRDNAGQKATEQ